jgi:hypothetical protein
MSSGFFSFLMEHHQEHHKDNLALIGDTFLENFPQKKS